MSMFRIFENPLDDSSITIEHTDNVLHAFLMIKAQYPQARIYKGNPCTANDVTPHDKATAFALLNADPDDQFEVICHAGAAVLPYIYYAVVAIMAAYSLYTALTMKTPSAAEQGSSNNDLSNRSNKQRLGARVADIFGTVKAIPDLISPPYSIYNSDGIEIEECLMCLGRGYYKITDVQDGDTAVASIAGASASFYDPYTSIIGTPAYQIGDTFLEYPKYIKKSASINGQTIEQPNTAVLESSDIWFEIPNLIKSSNVDFTQYFVASDRISLSGADYQDDQGGLIALDDTYTITSLNTNTIALTNPAAINEEWEKIEALPNHSTQGQSPEIRFDIVSSKYVGWFNFDMPNARQAVFNFFFPNGLYYQDSKGGVWDEGMTVTIEVQSINSSGDPIGSVTSIHQHIQAKSKSQFGRTVYVDLPVAGSFRFRLSRTTATQAGKTQDTCKIKSVYGMCDSEIDHFGNVTIVRTRTVATDGALSVKDRQINCIATRKLYSYATGERSATRVASHNFADMICELTTDPQIGRRSIDTLDVASLYATAAEIKQYFGADIEFNYTFDDAKMSYEETLAAMASVLFCDARRESNIVYFAFERPQAIPTLLFNHRNKVPQSEKRTSSFGVNKDYDGIQLTWIDPDDSWSESEIKLPHDDVINPQKIDAKGVTNRQQAYLLAHRAYNKLLYQRRAVEFQTYHEADLVTRNDLLLVADDTKQQVISSGAVLDQDGLYLQLSQRCELEAGQNYVIHLQLPNKSVDVIAVTQGDDQHEVLLARAPTANLILEYDGNLSCTQYIITHDTGARRDLFLVTEKSSDGTITAINYSDLYYNNDQDFLNP